MAVDSVAEVGSGCCTAMVFGWVVETTMGKSACWTGGVYDVDGGVGRSSRKRKNRLVKHNVTRMKETMSLQIVHPPTFCPGRIT